ncbi:MAG: AMP-binding protein [Legionella sp.]|uniref:alpha/beta fold hydrolase n=1 Tax=Legionella sp. TaxID=459 RepID=UPI00283DD8E8|nr:AMP-binding protein [Legionella sp.]
MCSNPYQTLNDILSYNKQNNPRAIAYRFILNDLESETINNAELYRRTFNLAKEIQEKAAPGERVILTAKPGLDFVIGFYACLVSRTIAVPIFPPANAMMASRFLHVIFDAKPKLILGDKQTMNSLLLARKVNTFMPGRVKNYLGVSDTLSEIFSLLKQLVIPILSIKDRSGDVFDEQQFSPGSKKEIAFLQYTSGSIGHPKGVMLSHGNLLHNVEIIKRVVNHSESSHSFSWLPPYHDMGLIAGIIEPLYAGIPATLMSTIDFIERPSRWMESMSKYQCTTTGGPNFAFELAVRKTSEALLQQLDLGHIEVIANGAEPLSVESINLFYDKFGVSGLQKGAILPCYGLAESTVMVSGKSFLTNELTLHVDPEQLKNNVINTAVDPHKAKRLVSSGIPQMDVKIVNPHTLVEAKPFEVGEIWIHGESVSAGYFNNADASEKTFNNYIKQSAHETKYLRTGDLGFMHQGELFVCGRLKNMIIIHGQNYYPHDIELVVASSDKRIRTGCVVAYATAKEGIEGLAVVVEVQKNTLKEDYSLIVNTIQKIIARQFQLAVREIFLVPARAIPKTTSGKLQRIKCSELLENGSIKPLFHYVHNSKKLYVSANNEDWVLALKNTPKKKYQQFFTTHIRTLVAEVLNIADAQAIDLNKGFFDLGMDSLMTVDFKTRLEDKLAHSSIVTKAVTFGYSNVGTMVKFLAKNWSHEQHHEEPKILSKSASTIEIKNNSSKAAVLLIHGLSSSPLEMMSCADALYQSGFSVRIPHYKTFGFDNSLAKKGVCVSRQAWKEEVLREFKLMQQEYEQIFVVGMCLGAILALELADNVGAQIQGVALLSTPFFYDGWAIPWYRSMIPLIGKTPLKKFISYKEKAPYGVKNETMRTLIKSSMEKNKTSAAGSQKISLFGIHEAYLLTQEVKKNINQINSSMLIIHAEEDETASLSNVKYIQNNIQAPKTQVVILKDSYHMITLDNEKHIVAQKITDFFNSLLAA